MKTQAAELIAALRRRWMTTQQLEYLGISTCPWKRLSESGHKHLRPGEVIKKRTRGDGLIEMKVEKV